MQWRTKIEQLDFPFDISHSDDLVFLGSCFSENIGNRFTDRRFKTTINPLGISFNPISIASQLFQEEVDESLSFKFEGEETNFLYQNQNVTDSEIKELVDKVKSSKVVFITLGTAWVHVHKSSGRIVTNCHKQPANLFQKRLLTVEEISNSLKKLQDVFPNQYFIYTISPVRHTREGLSNNQLSKSLLRVGVDSVLNEKSFYFPSYEMIVDDLRDYRFFEKDLIHPNDMAVGYIWEKVCDSFFNQQTSSELKTIESLLSRVRHKLLNPSSQASKEFLSKLKKDLVDSSYDWSRELSNL